MNAHIIIGITMTSLGFLGLGYLLGEHQGWKKGMAKGRALWTDHP